MCVCVCVCVYVFVSIALTYEHRQILKKSKVSIWAVIY